jgi:hypothetical protein
MQLIRLAQWLAEAIIKVLVGEVPGLNLQASPFWLVVTQKYGGVNHRQFSRFLHLDLSKSDIMEASHQIWWNLH